MDVNVGDSIIETSKTTIRCIQELIRFQSCCGQDANQTCACVPGFRAI